MTVTIDDLREKLPDFEEIKVGDRLTVNDDGYDVADKEARSPSPGESVYYLTLARDNSEQVLSWNPSHDVETAWIHPSGSNPMTSGHEVESIEYCGSPQ
ncbi:hypothetical protein GRX01_07830 [Halobaculum sp. WSA2]|uniref:Uncharacterized protein n=1 Tax=Halobaculum saliterrae TaxID=2073113 RepID=A0A6B0SRG5_9EURY|nr:hypothetical protein [Halobaculum saliterrae]MXR41245.1 hypothetical protein [Halobaculum saliterrae]